MSAMIYPTSNFAEQDKLCIERAKGVYVYDSNNKKYLEGMSGLWCTALDMVMKNSLLLLRVNYIRCRPLTYLEVKAIVQA